MKYFFERFKERTSIWACPREISPAIYHAMCEGRISCLRLRVRDIGQSIQLISPGLDFISNPISDITVGQIGEPRMVLPSEIMETLVSWNKSEQIF